MAALDAKITNIDALTNIAFFLHHPELSGRPLRKDETKLIAEWMSFRTKIKAFVPKWFKISSPSEPTNNSNTSNKFGGGHNQIDVPSWSWGE